MISRLSEVRSENYEDVQSLVEEEKPQAKNSRKGIVLEKDRKWYQAKGPAEKLSGEKWQPRKVGRCEEFEGCC